MQTINFGFSFYAVSAAEDACAQFTVRSGTMEPFLMLLILPVSFFAWKSFAVELKILLRSEHKNRFK